MFEDALNGVDARYTATSTGVKETLVLANASAPTVFKYDVRAAVTWSASIGDGAVVLRDGEGNERYRVEAPLAWDSATDPAFSNDLTLSVSKVSEGRWTVTLRPDATWLSDSARQFPVSIDPDFSWANGTTHFHGAQDCYLSGNTQANNTFCAQTYLQTGYYNRPYKSIFKFDIAAAIPSNATVNAATFKAYGPPQSVHFSANHSLSTITSDWDSTATWNNRKAGVPWTTAGGDVSSSASLKSTSTAVQASSAWYSWAAPLAAVQGWVNGTLPNYGFLLQTDAGAPSNNAYAWASTEASTSSSFPATSTEWPTLDVTWTQPAANDTTAPSPPSDFALGNLNASPDAIDLSWSEGVDPTVVNEPTSGLEFTEFRSSINGGAFTDWFKTVGDEAGLDALYDGDVVSLEARSRDAAGNVSTSVFVRLVAQTADLAAEETEREDAVEWYLDKFGGTLAQAEAWIDVTDASMTFGDSLESSTAAPYLAGVWADNETRTLHVALTAHPASIEADVLAQAAAIGVQDEVVISTALKTRAELRAAADEADISLAGLVDEGKAQISTNPETNSVQIKLSTTATSSDRALVAATRTQLAASSTLVDSSAARFGVPTSCGPHYSTLYNQNWAACDGKVLRGGVAYSVSKGNTRVNSGCTVGFLVRHQSQPGIRRVMTAGHCFDQGIHDSSATYYGAPFSTADDDWLRAGALVRYDYEHGHAPNGDQIIRGGDIAIFGVDSNDWTAQNWVLVFKSSQTTRNAQYPITDFAKPRHGWRVCYTGATRVGSTCGQVGDEDLLGGDQFDVDMCVRHGDSGGPAYSNRKALGIVSSRSEDENGNCIGSSQYTNIRWAHDHTPYWVLTEGEANRAAVGQGRSTGGGGVCRGNDKIVVNGACLWVY